MAKSPIDTAKLQRQIRAQGQLLHKLRMIRALHITAYNTPNPLEKTAIEFFYALGDILEGQPAEELKLNNIAKDEFLKEFHDG
jgi:hypothetical protein